MHNNPPVKVLTLIAVLIISAVLFGFLLKNFTNAASLPALLIASVAGLILLSLIIVFNILVADFRLAATGLFLCVLTSAIPFFGHSTVILFSGIALNFSILMYAYQNTRRNIRNSLTVQFWHTAHSVIGYASSGIGIFAILAYIALFNFSDPTSLKKTLEIAVRPLEPLFAQYIPNFSFRDPLEQIAARLLPDDLKLAPPEIKSQLIQQATSRLIGTLSGYIKIPIQAGDKIIDILYKSTIGKILNYSPLVRNLILVAAGLLIFLLLKFFLIFANWLGVLLAFVIYNALLKIKFFEIQLQSINKEVIVIK